MQVPVRQGLPRVPGGAPWPPVTTAEVAQAPRAAAADAETDTEAEMADTQAAALITVPLRRGLPRTPGGAAWPEAETAQVPAPKHAPEESAAADSTPEPVTELVTVPLRRGLPRTPGGAAWPEAETAQIPAPKHAPEESAAAEAAPEPTAPAPEPTQPKPAPQKPAQQKPTPQKRQAAGKAAPKAKPSKAPWLWGAALVVLAAIGVLAARWFVGTETGADFINRYDGRQPLPDSAPVGLPSWLAWSHFFNMFLMAMLIKTGLTQRREAKPAAYWAPRTRPREKISVNLWLHLVLDLAWVVLGVIFYVLLFATGQWMRIVPTSWEVFPHALSAGIQYLSLDWPNENPWVYYNALQELSYFLVVFVASPLAIISGARMSPVWPKRWTFPSMRTARALHFPTMIFFVVFLLIHIVLVATTGLRGNLNAMFAATDDPTGWTGTVLFVVAAAIIAGGWALARPVLVAPLAAKTGNVTQR
ncbi:cytochrome b/b6 domain-containing protein [Corynebacterium imitans]|uniref:cytochrome b/b6 domain-containing protein n=1 Tax=Corynebacterium imitans TaxID=156978 RepID=UPI001EF34F65|nr:cytochrome b/b6 domain-containing protein [Corynebacterium imitans]MCG7278294.1 cytochrome b/b6 domain-containing protein [Corynebacterium imitans]